MDPAPPFPESPEISGSAPAPHRTRLIHARALGSRLGLEGLHLKLEADNPTGSHKDRAAAEIVRWALRERAPGVTIGTCGNFGLALAGVATSAGLPCRVFVPSRYHGPQVEALHASGTGVTRTPGGYEEAVEASQEMAAREGWFDANPPGRGGEAAIAAYGAIVRELLDQLPGPPASIWIPNGNGTTLTGICRRLLSEGVFPRIGACGSAGNTALTASLAADRVVELDPGSLRETPENEPLLNWRSYHARQALEVFRRLGGWVHDATDPELVLCSDLVLGTEGIRTTPASAAALAGLRAHRENMVDPSGFHVVLLTS